MGVKGLWTLLSPCGHRIPIETLAGKKLAVDASIWLVQFLKAMRDGDGRALPHAHLLGMLNRICKLLFHRVRPVFVFDGAAPKLKRKTLAQRRRLRENAESSLRHTATKLLLNQIKLDSLQNKPATPAASSSSSSFIPPNAQVAPVAQGPVLLPTENTAASSTESDPMKLLDEAFGVNEDMSDDNEINELLTQLAPDQVRNVLSAHRARVSAQQLSDEQLFDEDAGGFMADDEPASASQAQPIAATQLAQTTESLRAQLLADIIHRIQQPRLAQSTNLSEFDDESDFQSDEEQEEAVPDLESMDSAALAAMPTSLQLEVMNQYSEKMRLKLRPEFIQANQVGEKQFSDVQLQAFLKTSAVNRRINKIRAEGNAQNETRRIASDASKEFIFTTTTDATKPEPKKTRKSKYNSAAQLYAAPARRPQDFWSCSICGHPNLNSDAECLLCHRRNPSAAIETTSKGNDEFEFNLWDEEDLDAELPARSVEDDIKSIFRPSILEEVARETIDISDEDDGASELVVSTTKTRANFEAMASISLPHLPSTVNTARPPPFNQRAQMLMSDDTDNPIDITPNVETERNASQFISLSDSDDDQQPSLAKKMEAEIKSASKRGIQIPEESASPLQSGGEPSAWSCSICTMLNSGVSGSCEICGTNRVITTTTTSTTSVTAESDSPVQSLFQASHSSVHTEPMLSADDLVLKPSSAPISSSTSTSTSTAVQSASNANSTIDVSSLMGRIRNTRRNFFELVNNRPSHSFDIADQPLSTASTALPQNASVNSTSESSTAERENEASDEETQQYEREADELEEIDEQRQFVDLINDFADAQQQTTSTVLNQSSVSQESRPSSIASPAAAPVPSTTGSSTTKRPIGPATWFTSEDGDEEDEPELSQSELMSENAALQAAARKSRRDEDVVTDRMIKEVQELLRLFGIPFVVSPAEAEAQCAELVRLNLVDGVITDDSDVFLFGATEIYKNIFESNKYVERYKMSEIESTLGIDRDKCIRLAMLLGSDYTDGIKGIGIVNATEVINAFPGPDGLREFREWIYSTVPDTKPAVTEETSPAIVQRLFKYKHRNMRRKLEVSVNFPAEQVMRAYWQPSVDSSTQQFEWCLPDISALRLFCQEQLSWSLAQCDQKLMPIMDALTGGELTQRRLQYFFDFDHQAGSIRSSRLNEAVGGLKRPNAQSEESSKRTRTASDTSSSQK